jgi:hypothetical protein
LDVTAALTGYSMLLPAVGGVDTTIAWSRVTSFSAVTSVTDTVVTTGEAVAVEVR